MIIYPPHPLSFPNKSSGNGIGAGDIFKTSDGKIGRMDEALHDGEAFVTWEDGTYGVISWANLTKVTQ